MRQTALASFVLALIGACGNTPPSRSPGEDAATPAAPARLVPDDELAGMRRAVDAELAAARTAKCVRPVLRGAAVPGNADEDLVALVDAAGELGACKQASPEGLRDSLSHCPPGDDAMSGPIAEPCRGRPLDDRRTLESHVMDSVMACGALADAVARAVSHDDACSPYLPGRRAHPASFRPLFALARAVEVRARHLAQEGQTAAALRVVFDWVRVGQDLGRGGAGFLPVMVATRAMQGPLGQAETILGEGRLAADELDALIGEADALLASEPSVAEVLGGERLEMLTADILPKLDHPEVAPPSSIPTRSFSGDASDELALGWLALDATSAAERAACPTNGSLKDCVAGLERVAREAEEAAQHLDRNAAGASASRRQAVTVLRSVAADVRIPFVKRLAFRRARLGALRLHLEWLRTAARAGACPTLSALATGSLGALTAPPGLGAPLIGSAAATGGVDLSAPAFVAPVRVWTLGCPAGP